MASNKEFDIVPVILAAGSSARLGFPKPLAQLGGRSALQIAIENCAGLQPPIVVLGHQASRIRLAVPHGVSVVVNRRWRSGQLASLLAGLTRVPQHSPFMVYPVDHPLLTPTLIRRIIAAFRNRRRGHRIVVPRFRGRAGHPTVFAAEMRSELRKAQTAREVVYREKGRVKFLPVRTPAIWQDFHTRASYRKCLREYQRQFER